MELLATDRKVQEVGSFKECDATFHNLAITRKISITFESYELLSVIQ